MSNVISFVRHESGYCNQCGKPDKLSSFRLQGHDPKIAICSTCMENIVRCAYPEMIERLKKVDIDRKEVPSS